MSARRIEPDDVESMRSAYAGRMLPDELVALFRDPTRAFATRVVRRGERVRLLPEGTPLRRDLLIHANGSRYDLYDYVSRNRVAGLLVLREGRIALESYQFGNDARTRWLSMSIAKSISTTLVGAAIRDGYIASVEDPITKYLTQLAGSSYDGVSIRDVLQMTTGVRWDDTHLQEATERRQMLELQFAQEAGAIMSYIGRQPRVAPPGTAWNYSTGETHIVGALLRAAVGEWPSDYLSARIWAPYGMEADATWWLESPGGLEVAGSGFGATLRDYGRFGLFALGGGCIDGAQVLPEGWMREAGSAREVGGKRVDYGYMWWPVPARDGSLAEGAFSARGIFGQYIYVNPAKQLVISVWSARSKPRGAEVIPDNDFFNAVAEVS
jgi:CubicO group peptidase (beta-lactamase class C family)